MKTVVQQFILLVTCLPAACCLSAQQQLIGTEPGRESIFHEDGMAITPLFVFKEAFTYNGKPLSYKTPPAINNKAVAMGFVFFTGGPRQEPLNSLAVLVAGYDTNEPEFYTDSNFNYAFESNERLSGKADAEGYYYFIVSNQFVNEGSHSFRIKRLAIPAERSAAMVNVYKHKPATAGNDLVPTDYWYRNERLNIAVARLTAGGKEYKIGLLDENANGLFNDRGADKILIADKEGRFSTFMGPGTFQVSEKMIIGLGDASFAVKAIDPAGISFLLEKTNETGSGLIIGGEIPDFTIPLLDGENAAIHSLLGKKPYTLLDFWGSWCAGCLQQLPELKKMQEEYAGNLQVIGLNKGDTKEKALRFIKEKGISWKQGMATDEMIKQLLIDGYPFYVLLDRQGRILGTGIAIKHILKLLQK